MLFFEYLHSGCLLTAEAESIFFRLQDPPHNKQLFLLFHGLSV